MNSLEVLMFLKLILHLLCVLFIVMALVWRYPYETREGKIVLRTTGE